MLHQVNNVIFTDELIKLSTDIRTDVTFLAALAVRVVSARIAALCGESDREDADLVSVLSGGINNGLNLGAALSEERLQLMAGQGETVEVSVRLRAISFE